MFGQVATEGQIFWYGRPAEAPKLLDGDELNSEVRRRQTSAYDQLSLVQEMMMKHIVSLTELVGDQSSSPADFQISDYLQQTCHLKDSCAVHSHMLKPWLKA